MGVTLGQVGRDLRRAGRCSANGCADCMPMRRETFLTIRRGRARAASGRSLAVRSPNLNSERYFQRSGRSLLRRTRCEVFLRFQASCDPAVRVNLRGSVWAARASMPGSAARRLHREVRSVACPQGKGPALPEPIKPIAPSGLAEHTRSSQPNCV